MKEKKTTDTPTEDQQSRHPQQASALPTVGSSTTRLFLEKLHDIFLRMKELADQDITSTPDRNSVEYGFHRGQRTAWKNTLESIQSFLDHDLMRLVTILESPPQRDGTPRQTTNFEDYIAFYHYLQLSGMLRHDDIAAEDVVRAYMPAL